MNAPQSTPAAEAQTVTPMSEEQIAEIRTLVAKVQEDRLFPASRWVASPKDRKSVLPPAKSFVVEDVFASGGSTVRASVGVFSAETLAEFVAVAREAVPALLAEVDRLAAELAQYVGHEPTLAEEAAYVRKLHRSESLDEAAEVAVRAARGCGDDERGQYTASVVASVGAELRRMAKAAHPDGGAA